ncbi:MAG: hypothetical protein IKO06_00015 [Alphaproteobacteria bacterium]|nr:hypothetical protein [Alphaproteobacteria bacterium]
MTDEAKNKKTPKPRKAFSFKAWRLKHRKKIVFVQKHTLIAILYGTAAYFVFSFIRVNYESLQFLTKLNFTTHQISNLVENIRTHYMVYDDEKEASVERLIEVDAIPRSIIAEDNRTLINPYGGEIIIAPSDKLRNVKDNLESTTFKMSYRNLPKDVCINLAMMDWGDKVKGLLAVAIGNYDEDTGVDVALEDIDRKETEVKFTSFTDDKGRRRSIRQRRHYSMNVTKPDDNFLPTPFSRGNARSGCKCVDDTCSFALRYTVFNVESTSQEKRQNESAFSRLRRRK